ncbi:response regulator [Desulfopila sp. IMCC35008]|uniref:response regulator n=1 Tax=Desulfopila sp. IMCC35008 TaxID=2653858 RepID=UPI001F0E90A3|nr:response regulator [Desulfopila sp. IMCC35008]
MEGNIKILVIDDEKIVRDIVRLWLGRVGFDVRVAENGRIGIEMQRADPAQVVICDLIMPEQEGMETISQLRKEFPDTGVIAISGGGQIAPDAYLNVAGQLGAFKMFTKPLPMEKVVTAINSWVEGDF